MENQRTQPPLGGTSGSTGRRLHIAHRRSPSELTPLMSMFTSPGMEQLAIQQQIELLRQQQQQIQATHQQYLNMGMIPAAQQFTTGNNFNTLQQQQIQNLPPQAKFQYPNHMQQAHINASMAPPTQPLSHRRNQSAVPNMGMGPPPAPSSGSSIIGYNDFGSANRENNPNKANHGGSTQGGGHQRRHSLALPEAIKAAELAQQKRTTSGFQFPVSAGPKENQSLEDQLIKQEPLDQYSSKSNARNGRMSHGRSQSVAVGADLRRGQAMRGSNSFQFPMTTPHEAMNVGQGNDFQRRGSYAGHNRNSSRNFEGNWRNQPSPSQSPQEQVGANSFQAQAQQPGFQPGHRARASMGQSISASLNSFQFGNQPQLVQLPQGQMALVSQPIYSAQQLDPLQMNTLQMNQFQTMQANQINGHIGHGSNQHNQLTSTQQQQQRKTLFTPYLPQATLPALLGDGQLVSGTLRVNKKNRSDAYVTTQDGLLDADIFICGSKDRNRALEGDLVAVELLDVDEVWDQKREKEEKKKRKDLTDGRVGSISNMTSSYKDDDELVVGESGLRRRGSLKQRPTQKKNDDVEVEGQSLLLVEEEEVNDEQRPLYAGHIVAVIERVPGQMFSGTLGLLRPSSQATREKQEAERQARESGAGRHHEQRQQDKPKIVWFKPTDKRVPLIAIPTEQAPRDFVEKHQDYADRIFVASIKRWPITSLHPFGTLVEQLGKMGEIKVETEALLRDNNFASDEFSDAVLRSVNLHNWSLEFKDNNNITARRDFRDEKVLTIDPNGTNEFDNAMHVKTSDDGIVEIGIHISDVTHFLKANSLMDREAKRRGTAVYLMNRSCPMLHPKIASQVCSLIPGEDRFAISLIFRVNSDNMSVLTDEVWIGKSIINSTGKLSYAEVDAVLSGNLTDKLDVEVEQIKILHAVARSWREKRLGMTGNAVPLRLIYQLDDENIKVEQNIFNSSPSHELFEELMIKTNFHVAQKLYKELPEKALLRRQGPPNPQRLQTFSDRMCKIIPEIDTTSSDSLQNSLCRVEDVDVRKGMETLLVKAMHRAKYYIAGRTPTQLHPHYALNLPLYTHFTSPLRRYADLVVHRQLEAILSEGKISYNEDIDNLVKTASSCNTKKDSAHNAQEQSIHIESCRIMDRKREEAGGELISEGIVLCVHESAFDVLIPEYGFEKRVHCDQIPLKKAEFRKEDRVLELYWEKGVSSSTYVPEDERLKVGSAQHAAFAAAAAKQAAVAERAKKEHEEAQRKNMETGTISTDDVDALFDDEDDLSDIADGLAGVSLTERPTQSVPPSPTKNSLHNFDTLHRTQSDSRVHTTENAEPTETTEKVTTPETTGIEVNLKEKYAKLFSLREENGEYIQDVKELMRVPVILKTDLTKSPPCLTIRSLNPYAL